MPAAPSTPPVTRLDALRTELADLAFELDRRGRVDAAEVVVMIGVRLGEIVDAELLAAGPAGGGGEGGR